MGGLLQIAAPSGYQNKIKANELNPTFTMEGTYEKIVITEHVRVPFASQILSDGFLERGDRFRSNNERPRARAEPERIIHEPPHARVKQTEWLAEERQQVAIIPFQAVSVARDAEGHLGLQKFKRWMKTDKAGEIRVEA